jgi:pimeloyl-ACP methyl ester carboxylesterase
VGFGFAASRRPGSPQVLLVNPHPLSILTYTDWWERLSARFDVVAVDLPNHGGSDADKTLVTVSQQAGFLPKILDHFGLEHPHYVGPDVGIVGLVPKLRSIRHPVVAAVNGAAAGAGFALALAIAADLRIASTTATFTNAVLVYQCCPRRSASCVASPE